MSTISLTPLHLIAAISRESGVILSRDATAAGLERELRTELDRGRVVRLRAGAYVLTAEWDLLTPDARYLRRVQAHAAVCDEPPIFSHHSAAAIWGLPAINAWPGGVDVLIEPAAGGRSRHGVTRHFQDGPVSIVARNGLLVTSTADTAVAMARILTFPAAVAMMDKAIHRPRSGPMLATRGDIERALAAIPTRTRVSGRGGAFRAADFAVAASGSPGESVSRAFIYLLGFLAPELQVRFDDERGFIAFVDFFWRRINKVGEFDGFGKYVKEEFTRGRSTVQVVLDEKHREDRVRACGPTVSRWDWPLLVDPAAFGRFLAHIGVPQVR
jgi:hypothetical protein